MPEVVHANNSENNNQIKSNEKQKCLSYNLKHLCNRSLIFQFLFLLVTLKLIFISYWFYDKFGIYASILSTLCNANALLIAIICLKVLKIEKKILNEIKKKNEALTENMEKFCIEADTNLKMMEKNVELLMVKLRESDSHD